MVIKFYGFDGDSKVKYPNLTLKKTKESLIKVNIEEHHLALSEEKVPSFNFTLTESEGKDVFRTIKAHQGQYKLPKVFLYNYQSKCAMCNITDPKLLITSHSLQLL